MTMRTDMKMERFVWYNGAGRTSATNARRPSPQPPLREQRRVMATPQSTTVSPPVESATIELPCGRVAVVDAADLSRTSGFRWASVVDGPRVYVWAWHAGQRKNISLHRLVMDALSSRMGIDHVNGNGLDCRRANLRFATHTQNARNQRVRAGKKSKYKGVVWHHSKQWRARIWPDNKAVELGFFADEVEAARAYDDAARQLYGEFARLNFPK